MTLCEDDLERAVRFYAEGLSLETAASLGVNSSLQPLATPDL
jgi:hypothetical protein